MHVFSSTLLKGKKTDFSNVIEMLPNNGKLMVYTSGKQSRERMRIVGSAVEKVAQSLELETEHSARKKLLSIYVYYQSYGSDEIPVYCDWGKRWKEKDVYRAIRNMMFVLSFHPRHQRLRSVREEVCMSA